MSASGDHGPDQTPDGEVPPRSAAGRYADELFVQAAIESVHVTIFHARVLGSIAGTLAVHEGRDAALSYLHGLQRAVVDLMDTVARGES